MKDIKMPSFGTDMKAGTFLEWRVQPGDTIHEGDIIAEVDTQKGIIEIEAFDNGVIRELIAKEDQEIPVGQIIARIEETEKERVEKPAETEEAPSAETKEKPSTQEIPPQKEAQEKFRPDGKHIKASPLAKRIAQEEGIDLSTIVGTGPGGAIEKRDIEQYLHKTKQEPAKAPGPEATTKSPTGPSRDLSKMRQAIAAAMERSKKEIPHYYLQEWVDMTQALTWLAAINKEKKARDRLLPVIPVLKAIALSLKNYPELNGYWKNGGFEQAKGVHIGMAISLREGGLVIPAVHNVDELSADDLMAKVSDIIQRSRKGRLKSSELSDGTFTFTNLGNLGAESVYGVIYPPQVAIAGMGRIIEKPYGENGMVGTRKEACITLSADHRATDGYYGSRFLTNISKLLQEPHNLFTS